MAKLELLATDLAAVEMACEIGADRIELCAALGVGGVTPGPGLLKESLRIAQDKVDVVVLVRPRAGDFCLRHPLELEVQVQDVRAARDAGAAGVAVGVLTPDGFLDEAAMARLVEAAGTLPVTLHRAVDAARDSLATARTAAGLGVSRILTSGRAASAWEGRAQIAEIVRTLGSRVEVIAGAGVRSAHARALLGETNAGALHGSCSIPAAAETTDLGMGFAQRIDGQEAAALLRAIRDR